MNRQTSSDDFGKAGPKRRSAQSSDEYQWLQSHKHFQGCMPCSTRQTGDRVRRWVWRKNYSSVEAAHPRLTTLAKVGQRDEVFSRLTSINGCNNATSTSRAVCLVPTRQTSDRVRRWVWRKNYSSVEAAHPRLTTLAKLGQRDGALSRLTSCNGCNNATSTSRAVCLVPTRQTGDRVRRWVWRKNYSSVEAGRYR